MSAQIAAKPNEGETTGTWTAFRRMDWVKAVLCVGMSASLLLSRRLWLSGRSYPLTPVWAGLPPIPTPWDRFIFWGLIGLLMAAAITSRPRPWMLGVIGLGVLLALEDQSRWQPWLYQYLLMLGALTLFPWSQNGSPSGQETGWRAETALGTCRFLIACIYFWSGVHKMNWTFVHDIFPWMVAPVAHHLPHLPWPKMALIVPFVECTTGLGLLIVRGRPYAVAAALATHAFILVCLGPWGLDWNSVVWPWNVAMVLFVLLLFGRGGTPFFGSFLKACRQVRRSCLPALALVLFGVMPAFSFFGLWDSYLSVSLYSGDIQHTYLRLSTREAQRLPKTLQRLGVSNGDTVTLDLADWSNGELNVPPYPEARVFKSVARSLCIRAAHPAEIGLIVQAQPNRRTGAVQEQTYPCTNLR